AGQRPTLSLVEIGERHRSAAGTSVDLGATAGRHFSFIINASNSSKEGRLKDKEAKHKGGGGGGPETPFTENGRLSSKHTTGAIPIGENDRLIGMVTDRDIVCKGLAQDDFDLRRATARDVMKPGIHCCREDDDLAKAVRHMEVLEVRRLPVINKSKRMVGMLA